MPPIPFSALDRLTAAVEELRDRALELEAAHRDEIAAARPEQRDSARNLVHYLALRQQDLRGLQRDLGGLGLSSLGRLEGHALATLDSVLDVLHQLAGTSYERTSEAPPGVNPPTAGMLLDEHTRLLLGQRPMRRAVRIMVTMPSEAAVDDTLVRGLLAAGMNVMRINCAHDGPEEWTAMVRNLRQAERQLGLTCRVQADLPGPKLRTGPLQPLGRALKLRPERDGMGRTVHPARAWITVSEGPEEAPNSMPAFRATDGLPASAQEGDLIFVRDGRGRRRALRVVERRGASCIAETRRTVYVGEGSPLEMRRRGEGRVAVARAEGIPEVVEPIMLREGDDLMLTRAETPGEPAQWDGDVLLAPAHIHCSSVEAFERVRAGERVYLDDGKIAGVVTAGDGQTLTVRITGGAREKGAKLRAEKGINFPDTDLDAPCLGPADVAALEAVVGLVDMVALSFVRQPSDVGLLRDHLARRGAPDMGVVLKVENHVAFENLPRLLLAALQSRPVGVMVARGDLGVEVGFERLSEVQEEILWLCEAAHVPVIWATQVLEGLAKTGSPTRAEVTDAAMSGRAECVMLNKGPHVVQAVEFLSGVLERMDAHQLKKTSMLRRLSVSDNLRRNPAPAARM
jgi:pyruvate kinase